MRGPPPQTLSHETLIVPCPSPASNQNPSRRWSDWPHAGGAASHSAPDAAKTTTVVCTEPLRIMCSLFVSCGRTYGVTRALGLVRTLLHRRPAHLCGTINVPVCVSIPVETDRLGRRTPPKTEVAGASTAST